MGWHDGAFAGLLLRVIQNVKQMFCIKRFTGLCQVAQRLERRDNPKAFQRFDYVEESLLVALRNLNLVCDHDSFFDKNTFFSKKPPEPEEKSRAIVQQIQSNFERYLKV